MPNPPTPAPETLILKSFDTWNFVNSLIPSFPISIPFTSILAKTALAINPPCLAKNKFVFPELFYDTKGLVLLPLHAQ